MSATLAIVLIPLLGAVVAFALPSNRLRPWLLPPVAIAQVVFTGQLLRQESLSYFNGWVVLDPVDRVVLPLVSVLFAACALYAPSYLRYRRERDNRVFVACVLALASMMSLVVLSHHLGLMWVAMEATTLAGAPLVYFNRTPLSLEATFKFLLIGSVGIALALLGSFFLAYAMLHSGLPPSLLISDLVAAGPKLSSPWLRAAFVFLLVGYGTKMGIAPMHTWKPDAYGQAPGLVGALFAGGVTSCAFLIIARVTRITQAAGEAEFARRCLLILGILSVAVAAVFLIRQRDFKRMLAYSSVEHMGILCVGLALGGAALLPTLLHLVNNGLTKGVLFMAAGNIHRAFDSKSVEHVHGAGRRLPWSAGLLLAGTLAMTASPPFGPFVSVFGVVQAAVDARRFGLVAALLALLLAVFMGMVATVLTVVQGRPSDASMTTGYRDGVFTAGPAMVLMLAVLVLGLHIPDSVLAMLEEAARFMEQGR